MFQAGSMILSLWWRDKLDVDQGVAVDHGYGRVSLAYAVDGIDAVDRVFRCAVDAGASIARESGHKPFGYSGVFADPEGHTWEVAWVRGWTVHSDGAVTLPG